MAISSRNEGFSRKSTGMLTAKKSLLRPQTAYGGVKAPERNIKSIVNYEMLSAKKKGQEKLKSHLDHLNVGRANLSHSAGGRKMKMGSGGMTRTSYSKFPDKQGILRNWIAEELHKFEQNQASQLKGAEPGLQNGSGLESEGESQK